LTNFKLQRRTCGTYGQPAPRTRTWLIERHHNGSLRSRCDTVSAKCRIQERNARISEGESRVQYILSAFCCVDVKHPVVTEPKVRFNRDHVIISHHDRVDHLPILPSRCSLKSFRYRSMPALLILQYLIRVERSGGLHDPMFLAYTIPRCMEALTRRETACDDPDIETQVHT
jgi:hypothetical protein